MNSSESKVKSKTSSQQSQSNKQLKVNMMPELPFIDNPTQSVSLTLIDEYTKQAENTLKQLQSAIKQGQEQIQQLTINNAAVQGQIALLNDFKKKLTDLESTAPSKP
jgi:uncharacterized membrane protein YdfJ with MMPL/SSD domain